MAQGRWLKFRKSMSKYPKTQQQKKIKVGGELIKKVCTGKKGKDFVECRTTVLKCAFDDSKCDDELRELKREILEKD